MKRKFLAGIAVFIILFSTTLLPAGNFLISTFGAQTAYAGATEDAIAAAAKQADAKASPTAPNNQTSAFDSCSWYDVLCGLVQFTNFLLAGITGFIAELAADVLDFSMHYSISSSTYADAKVNGILVSGWKLIRDFSTIFLMFALFVVAFMLIFNAEGSEGSWAAHFSPGRTIARVIIVALLVNFSFLMCRAVIDVGNIFAIILYDKIDQGNKAISVYQNNTKQTVPSGIGSGSGVFSGTPYAGIKSISVGLLSNINPQKVFLASGAASQAKLDSSFYLPYLFTSFVAAIINLLMLFIFVSMAFLFLGRIIGLYLGIILSPFAFVSWTIPFLQNMPFIGFDNWLKELVGFTFLAPVYMLFVYLTVAFMQIPSYSTTATLLSTAVFAVINSLLCLFVLMKGKKISESMAGEFGKIVGNLANRVATAGVGLAIGGVGLAASGTVGLAGGAIANSGMLKRAQDAGPSQDQESVQRRMKTASTFRKFGMNGLANSIQRGDYSMGGLKSNAARGVRNMGKGLATTNPLDAKIAGLSVRNSAAAMAKLSGNRDLAAGLIAGQRAAEKNAMIKNRAFDIEATRNARNTITNNPPANPPANPPHNPTNNPPANPPHNPTNNPPANPPANPPTTPPSQKFSLAGMTQAGQIRPPSIKPPDNPPTGGATPVIPTKPPANTSLPVRLAGNAPLDQKTSGVTMPRSMFNQNMKPQTTPATSSKENIPTLTGDEEMDNMLRKQMMPTRKENAPTLTGDEEMDNALRATAASTPTTKSGSNSTTLLSGIAGTAPVQPEPQSSSSSPTKPTFGDGSAKAPEYTPVQQERILNKAIASQERSAPQVTERAVQKSEAFEQASSIAGTRSAAVQSVNANQSALVAKNMGTAPIIEKAPSYVPPVIIGSTLAPQTDQEKIKYHDEVLEKQIRSFEDTDTLRHSGFNDFITDHYNSHPGSADSIDKMIATKESAIDAWRNRKVDQNGKYIKE